MNFCIYCIYWFNLRDSTGLFGKEFYSTIGFDRYVVRK